MKVAARKQAIFVGTATEALRSIVEGSALTGAPGQLVDSGNLKASWNLSFPSRDEALIVTNVVYAPDMEEGTREGRALTQHSATGGFHSVSHTRTNIDRIVEAETLKAGGGS